MIRPMRGVAPQNPLTNWPYLASPKIDGIRCIIKDGKALSKTMKPLPNLRLHELFGHLEGADGEITVGPAYQTGPDDDVYDRTRGPVMRKTSTGDEDFRFWVFDRWDTPQVSARHRLRDAEPFGAFTGVQVLTSLLVHDQDQLDRALAKVLAKGFEGLMLRDPNSPYKYGQSTENEGYLLKIKPFNDSEAVVLDVVEQMTNTNAAETNEAGYTKRSSSKSGKVGNGTFGAFKARDLYSGVEFDVGGGRGVTKQLRDKWWANRDVLVGNIFRYTFQEVGTKNAPRLPQFAGWRDPIDLADLGGAGG